MNDRAGSIAVVVIAPPNGKIRQPSRNQYWRNER